MNSKIVISEFAISFNNLTITGDAITFYNLTYYHPSSCNSEQSIYPIYNYTSRNTIFYLPYVVCTTTLPIGGGGSSNTIGCYSLNKNCTLELIESSFCPNGYFEDYSNCLDESLEIDKFIDKFIDDKKAKDLFYEIKYWLNQNQIIYVLGGIIFVVLILIKSRIITK